MGKVVLINAYEYPYLGTRVLASYLRKFGHETHNILLGDDNNQYVTSISENHHGYAIVSLHDYSTYLGRSCTGTCSYCSGGQWRSLYREEGKKAYPRRNRNYMDVIDELSTLPDNVKFIFFMDEFWSMPKKDALDFFKLYKERINKNFFAYLQYE